MSIRFPFAITFAAALVALSATGPAVFAQQSNRGAALIEDRMQRLYADGTQAEAASPQSPTSPPAAPAASVATPTSPHSPPPIDKTPERAGDQRLPARSDQPGGITSQLINAGGNDSGHANSRPLPGDGEDPNAGGWVINTLAALGVVVALILALRWGYLRATGQPGSTSSAKTSRAVEPLSRTAIAPKNHVLLLRVGRRVLVVNDSAHGMRTLANIDDPDEVADLLESVTTRKTDSSSNTFNGLLARFAGHSAAATTRDAEFDLDHAHHAAPLPDEGRDHREHEVDRARDQLSQLLSRVRSTAGTVGGKGGER